MQIPFAELPDEAFVRLPVVRTVTALSRSSVDDEVKKRRFPAPYKLTGHAAGWKVGEIRAWLRSRGSSTLQAA
jgi:prophage regulatory protein